MGINKQLFMYWSLGTTISYLRYLAVATWRYHHPNWPIYVYQSEAGKASTTWDFGDFQMPTQLKDYTDHMKDVLKVEFKTYEPCDEIVNDMPPPNISDIFSYDMLYREGGWYADMDAVCVKNFDYISEQDYGFIGFGGLDDWVGVFGAAKESWVMKSFIEPCIQNYKNDNYNSTGTYGIIGACTSNNQWQEKFRTEGRNWRMPREGFYPVHCRMDKMLWEGNWEHSKAQTWSVHLYGGNSSYASANKRITPEYLKDTKHTEWICRYIRSLNSRELFLI